MGEGREGGGRVGVTDLDLAVDGGEGRLGADRRHRPAAVSCWDDDAVHQAAFDQSMG